MHKPNVILLVVSFALTLALVSTSFRQLPRPDSTNHANRSGGHLPPRRSRPHAQTPRDQNLEIVPLIGLHPGTRRKTVVRQVTRMSLADDSPIVTIGEYHTPRPSAPPEQEASDATASEDFRSVKFAPPPLPVAVKNEGREDEVQRPGSGNSLAIDGTTGSPGSAPGDATFEEAENDAARDVVIHGGGAIELMVPLHWQVSEVPHGRELCVLLTPTKPPRRLNRLSDGLWVCYHLGAMSTRQSEDQDLSNLAAGRLRAISNGSMRVDRITEKRIHNCPAVVHDISSAIDNPTFTETVKSRRGRHVLIRTQWGIVETYAITTNELYQTRKSQWAEMMRDMLLRPPPPIPSAQSITVHSAASILGLWKSFRARMRLTGDGRVTIRFDRPHIVPVDRIGSTEMPKTITELTGQFLAADDLLQVTWDDGSKLNYRWRLHHGELLLTDHQGQTSHLKRILE